LVKTKKHVLSDMEYIVQTHRIIAVHCIHTSRVKGQAVVLIR